MSAESLQLDFRTLDVFTRTKYEGNPLAIVSIPKGADVSQEQKQAIAREFNLSETTFVHESEVNNDRASWSVDIFMTSAELPFAGHPIIGTACHVFSKWARQSGLKEGYLRGDFIIKAGKVGLRYDIEKKTATATIPHDFHIHGRKYSKEELLKLQPQLSSFTLKEHYPVVSVVKGMTFILVELESEEVLAKVSTTGQAMSFDGLDQDWNETFVGMYFFVRYPDQDGVKVLRTRMIEGTLEDPATGSAASDLAGYLSLTESQPKETVRYQLTQGVEMGRRSDIFLEVKRTDGDGIAIVNLEGSAVQVIEGRVQV